MPINRNNKTFPVLNQLLTVLSISNKDIKEIKLSLFLNDKIGVEAFKLIFFSTDSVQLQICD